MSACVYIGVQFTLRLLFWGLVGVAPQAAGDQAIFASLWCHACDVRTKVVKGERHTAAQSLVVPEVRGVRQGAPVQKK